MKALFACRLIRTEAIQSASHKVETFKNRIKWKMRQIQTDNKRKSVENDCLFWYQSNCCLMLDTSSWGSKCSLHGDALTSLHLFSSINLPPLLPSLPKLILTFLSFAFPFFFFLLFFFPSELQYSYNPWLTLSLSSSCPSFSSLCLICRLCLLVPTVLPLPFPFLLHSSSLNRVLIPSLFPPALTTSI